MGKAKKAGGPWPEGGLSARRRKRARGEAMARLRATGGGRGPSVASVLASVAGRQGAPAAGRAQTALMAQCLAREPDKKSFLRAWAKGARFDHSQTPSWPGMYLSSVRAGFLLRGRRPGSDLKERRAWLWDAMAREGADLAQTRADGLGFELIAAQSGDEEALAWWKSRGFGLQRRTLEGDSAWRLAFCCAPEMVAVMASLWPEEADAQAVSEELYALAREAEAGSLRPMRRAMALTSMRRWVGALARWPELIRPSQELSQLMRKVGAPLENVEGMERLESAAMATAESEALERVVVSPAMSRAKERAGL